MPDKLTVSVPEVSFFALNFAALVPTFWYQKLQRSTFVPQVSTFAPSVHFCTKGVDFWRAGGGGWCAGGATGARRMTSGCDSTRRLTRRSVISYAYGSWFRVSGSEFEAGPDRFFKAFQRIQGSMAPTVQ